MIEIDPSKSFEMIIFKRQPSEVRGHSARCFEIISITELNAELNIMY